MNARTFQVLQPEEIRRLTAELARHEFADGRKTAVGAARAVKRNLQLEAQGPDPGPLERIVLDGLGRSTGFRSFALPRRLLMPRFARYAAGMEYGSHLDDALMGPPGGEIRTDLSITVFLNEPDRYDGGELVLELPLGEQEIKLAAGEAVVYPSNMLHRVAPVTRGERVVAITWVQSNIRDENIRAILWDLFEAAESAERAGLPEIALRIGKGYHNLLRRFAET